jgi:uncharacterized SAM-binding protein YcdF (DUF218 family)
VNIAMAKKSTGSGIATIIISAALAGCAAFLLSRAALWLAVEDPAPARIDVIFTFGGENVRVSYSRELMARFPQAHWVISDYSHRYARLLQRLGFDMSRVTILDTCRYTISEVRGLADWLKAQGSAAPDRTDTLSPDDPAKPAVLSMRPLHIALVSNPLHMRRIRLIAEKTFRDPAIRLHCLPVPLDRYGWTRRSLEHWWETKSLRTWVWSETAKILAYLVLFSWG